MENKVEFLQHNLPNLQSGRYTLDVEQTIYTPDGRIPRPAGNQPSFSTSQDIFISGQRFLLDGGQVRAVFPPQGNYGNYSQRLPHITLNRPTLPWERAVRDNDTKTPWMALLVLEEGDIITEKQLSLANLRKTASETPAVDFPTVEMELCEDEDENVNVIDVKKGVLGKIIPSVEELRYLVHIRKSDTEAPFATVIANRLPKPNVRNIVHLVSLDDRYDAAGNFVYNSATNDEDLVRLVSLHKWSFTVSSPDDTFARILNRVGEGTSTLKKPVKASDPEFLTNILNEGNSVLPQFFRDGSSSISYYRGPFVPGFNSEPLNLLPAMNQDQLMIFDSTKQMFDTSYASAWIVGRMLTLQNKRVSGALYEWKRKRMCQITSMKQREGMTHLPQYQRAMANAPVPEVVTSWFDSLSELTGVPFVYLVPDEAMLPEESIRFFQVDTNWVACLLDGALSIGRNSQQDTENDKMLISEVLTRPSSSNKKPCFDDILRRYKTDEELAADTLPTTACMSGVLLRSSVVAGWPDLLVDGFDEVVDASDFVPSASAQRLVRKDNLSTDTLVCLFEGEVGTVDFHLMPEALQFGVNDPNNPEDNCPQDLTGTLTNEQILDCTTHKVLRDADGSQSEEAVKVPFKNNDQENQRVIDVLNLVTNINTKMGFDIDNSAELALQMIEGAEKIRFNRG